jgi:DNA invertase Pin-like site-specific DNA recombinase
VFQKQCSVAMVFVTTLFGTVTSRSIGYARTSGGGDTKQAAGLEVQIKALKDAGCDVVFQEIVSTRTPEKDRHQLQAALNAVMEGDEIVVTALSRIGRTQREVINRLHDLQEQGVHIRTLDGLVNTRALGKFAPVLIGLLTGLNEVEREVTRDRVLESIQHRRETGGKLGGRPKTNQAKERLVLRLREEGCSYRSIREQTGLALSTIRRIISEQEVMA